MSIASVIKTKGEDTRDELLAKADDVVAKGAQVISTAEDKAKEATEAAMNEISTLVATLNDKIAALGLDTASLSEKAKSGYADLEKIVTREVADRPVRTLAFVGLAGLALGLLSRK